MNLGRKSKEFDTKLMATPTNLDQFNQRLTFRVICPHYFVYMDRITNLLPQWKEIKIDDKN